MKKNVFLSTVLLAACISLVITGCGQKNSGSESKNGNESKTETQSQTGTGNKSKGSECAYNCPGTGFGFDLPESVKITNGFLRTHDMGDMDYDSGVMMAWPVYLDTSEENVNALTQETMGQVHTGLSFRILCVKDVKTEEEAKEKIFALIEKMMGEVSEDDRKIYSQLKEIHREDGYLWLMYMIDREEDIRDECKEEYSAFYDASDQIISSMKFYTPEVWKGGEEGTALTFETIDLNGNPVNSKALFSQNKVTMINIWATTCGPCIEEMPELEAMDKEFRQKGGAVVGLVDDVWVNNMKYLDEAKSIVQDTGVTYINLCAWEGYYDVLASVGTPTTYFVDSKGQLIGDPILGASTAKYREKMEEYLAKAE